MTPNNHMQSSCRCCLAADVGRLGFHDRGALPSRCFWRTFCEMISQWRFNISLSGTPLRLGKMRGNIAFRLNVELLFS
jgi:hypothetical protein